MGIYSKGGNLVKRYIVFSISFIILFVLFQVLSGYFLTLFYTSDPTSAWDKSESLPSNIAIKGRFSFIPLLFSFLAATIAYFIPEFFVKRTNILR